VPLWLNLIHLTTKDHEVRHKGNSKGKRKKNLLFQQSHINIIYMDSSP